ncbi:MAG: bifunctional phosphopantothenoylcysteine decarboxylase/phosphopantothenate--cysteine ligase CoaBC [Pseudomonadaceae bacterium]|nr:bifunctional phosphopantothenoylcysteine decarboxylase/phosphopantothenate--cysteine ligase CoaBC [Pseudomonadaceae bacterium]
MNGKNIVLGITGGIAAYKAPALVRELTAAGADVQVVTSRGAGHFVGKAALQAVSGRPVRDDLWDEAAEAAMGHIELARWADIVLVAPATANFMANAAAGSTGDLLTTIVLATEAPVVLAPAMNQQMWQHPATQRNLETLISDGVTVLGPASGEQACGENGPGRMLQPEEIAQALANLTSADRALANRHVVITAGPTVEAIDPVRFLSNHSSGKQGYALAQACIEAGARVTLISGPVTVTAPSGANLVSVTSAQSMLEAAQRAITDADVFIGVAAVADYRVDTPASQKLKRSGGDSTLTLSLVENPDIIATLAKTTSAERTTLFVGFAAETNDVLKHAREKRIRKGLDMIVVNDVGRSDIGFGSDINVVTVIDDAGEVNLGPDDKLNLSREIARLIGTKLGSA